MEFVKQILQNFLTCTLRNKERKQFLGQKKGGARKTAVKLKFLFLTMFLPLPTWRWFSWPTFLDALVKALSSSLHMQQYDNGFVVKLLPELRERCVFSL